MLLSLKTHAKWTELVSKRNTRMRMKIVIHFVNDEKVMQKQGVLNFDHIDQQSTCRRPLVTNNQE